MNFIYPPFGSEVCFSEILWDKLLQVRVSGYGGWFLLRLSLHDPVLPLNIEVCLNFTRKISWESFRVNWTIFIEWVLLEVFQSQMKLIVARLGVEFYLANHCNWCLEKSMPTSHGKIGLVQQFSESHGILWSCIWSLLVENSTLPKRTSISILYHWLLYWRISMTIQSACPDAHTAHNDPSLPWLRSF